MANFPTGSSPFNPFTPPQTPPQEHSGAGAPTVPPEVESAAPGAAAQEEQKAHAEAPESEEVINFLASSIFMQSPIHSEPALEEVGPHAPHSPLGGHHAVVLPNDFHDLPPLHSLLPPPLLRQTGFYHLQHVPPGSEVNQLEEGHHIPDEEPHEFPEGPPPFPPDGAPQFHPEEEHHVDGEPPAEGPLYNK